MRRKWLAWVGCFVFALFLALAGKTDEVLAASDYKAVVTTSDVSKSDRTVGGVTFLQNSKGTALYTIQGTKKTKIAASKEQYGLSWTVLSDGETVYFSKRAAVETENGNGYQSTIYSCTADGKNVKKIAACEIGGSVYFAGYYANKIYFIKGSAYGELYSLDLSTKKIKEVYSKDSIWTTPTRSSGRYIYCYLWGETKNIAVFDCKTSKLKTLGSLDATLVNGASVSPIVCDSNYVWYITGWAYSEKKSYSTISIVRCNLNGTGKKTLVKNLKVINSIKLWDGLDGLKAFTGHSVTYLNTKRKAVTKKF